MGRRARVIRIGLYNNGFRIEGRASPRTCGEVSIMSWSCICTAERVDKTCQGYVSKTDAARHSCDPQEAVSRLIFDTNNAKAMFVYQEFSQNIRDWATDLWPKEEVQIERVSSDLGPIVSGRDPE